MSGWSRAVILWQTIRRDDRDLVQQPDAVSVPLVWALGTLLIGFMAFPNLIGLLFLAGTVRTLTQEYFSTPR